MSPDQLSHNANQLFSASMEWLDAHWDEQAGLIQLDPSLSYPGKTEAESLHFVRETAFYSLGLFLRGDTDRALRALDRVLQSQLTERDTDHCGSFLRHPEETILPKSKPVEWLDYNPNWREYIGVTLAMILCEFADQLPEPLLKRTDSALRRATAGSLWRRVPAEYTHIALLKAFLLSFCGVRYDLEAWLEGGEMQGREIFRVFKEHDCFPSYNSPTDYGIDLIGLALWRKHAPSQSMKTMAQEMEESLWGQITEFYHAGMGNLAGPYDRAYGMDMRSYGSPLGLCIWASVGKDHAPFPALNQPFPQQHEIALALPILVAEVSAPARLHPPLKSFQNERRLQKQIASNDTATAWLGKELMLGGRTKPAATRAVRYRPASPFFTNYPATLHWVCGDKIGWISAHSQTELKADANERSLSIRAETAEGSKDLVIKLMISSPTPPIFTLDKWSFPSLTVHVSSNLSFSAPAGNGGLFEIECRLPTPQQSAFVTLNCL